MNRHKKPAEASAIYTAALAEYPDSVELCSQTARFFATYPDPAIRRPEEALRLARHATEIAPRNAGAWNLLGIAFYRSGQWQEAVEALQKSMELHDGGDAWDWFYLAMALRQLGQQEEAKKWFAPGRRVGTNPAQLAASPTVISRGGQRARGARADSQMTGHEPADGANREKILTRARSTGTIALHDDEHKRRFLRDDAP